MKKYISFGSFRGLEIAIAYPRYASLIAPALACQFAGAIIFSANCALAQITPDSTLPNNSNVKLEGNTRTIEGGTTRGGNLFHSFSEFSVPNGSTAFFNNSLDIQNILTRVTGSKSISNIDGLIRANGKANLFLLNPNGIIFGNNARLNIGGSFIASTANAIKFADNFEFKANSSQTTPLLTINLPIGLQYGVNPESIQIQDSNLQVGTGQTLALIGGNVSMSGGQLFASGGRIELGGLTAPGLVELNTNSLGKIQNLNFPVEVQRADVELTNGAQVLVTGAGGGNIAVNTRNLNLLNRSSLNAGITNNAGTADTIGGDIDVNASEIITLRDSSLIQNIINLGAKGNAGKINIVADSLNLLSGSQLFSFTYGQGNGGEVNVQAANTVSLDSAGNNASTSGIINSVDITGEGNAGNINITTGSLTVTNGAQLNTITSGRGNAGAVNIRAANTVTFDGANVGASGIISAVGTTGVGKGGEINITAGSVAVTNGAQLNAITRNEGDAGNVNINARDTVLIDGENPNSINDPYAGVSSIFTSVGIDDQGRQARGNGGNINITAGSLLMTNGGQLNAITRGMGNAGNVNINARDAVILDGERRISSTRAASAIFTSVDGNEYSGFANLGTAIGNGGDITITTGRLAITRGAALNALTKGQGNAGNVTINARGSVTLDSENSNGGASGIFSSVDTNLYTAQPPAIGDGGDVKITTDSLTITRGAGVFVTTQARGNAGDVTINARDIVAIDGENRSQKSSGIFSSVDANLYTTKPVAIGNGGNILIGTGSLFLTNGGELSAITQGQGNAGDVTINARDTVAIDGENSQKGSSGVYSSVAGNLYSDRTSAIGNGGDIDISANLLSVKNGGGLFAATAGRGDAGSVNINTRQALFDGVSSSGGSSGIFSDVESTAVGNGRNINITARKLTVSNDAKVSTNSEGNGSAGNIVVDSNSILLDKGFLSSDTVAGEGNINLNPRDLLIMRRNSEITTKASGNNITGGNITIDGKNAFLVAVKNENSNIRADSKNFRGGNVKINVAQIFGFQSQTTSFPLISSITAKGASPDLSGNIQINTPDTDPSKGLVSLTTDVVDVARLVDDNICAKTANSSFTYTGSGGLPASPNNTLNSDAVWEDWRLTALPKEREGEKDRGNSKSFLGIREQGGENKSLSPTQVVEAQGWIINQNGEVILTAYAPTATPHKVGSSSSGCQSAIAK